MPYDRAIVAPNPEDRAVAVGVPAGGVEATAPGPRHRHATRRRGAGPGDGPRSWPTVLAFGVVLAPFLVAVVRLLLAPAAHLTLPDDLALIDLHTRRALAWHQQLGVFDRNGWNHPGPAYFYLVSLVYRVLGSGARSLFVAATLLNAAAAALCLATVRRRSDPARTLWAAAAVGGLTVVLAAGGPSATTYSESVLGAVVSPWNPMVVIFPLLLTAVLAAAACDRSWLSLLGAVLAGSFVVQTDISALPLVAVVLVGAGAVLVATTVADRRGPARAGPDGGAPGAADGDTAGPPPRPPVAPRPPAAPRHRVPGWAWGAAGGVLLVLMWLPPVVEQFTNDPGNLTLIVRYFRSAHTGQSLLAGWWSLVAVHGMVVGGPGVVMAALLGGPPAHAGAAVAVTVASLALAAGALGLGLHQRRRFAAGLGGLTLVGAAAVVVAVTHVSGLLFGYLVVWAVVLPVVAVMAAGQVGPSGLVPADTGRRPLTAGGLRAALAVVAVAVAVAGCARVAALPPLAAASDPVVGRLAALVAPYLAPGGRVFVGDAGAGTARTQLLDTERFIGLVNQLDLAGDRPRVNHLWRAQFGPGYQADGTEPRRIVLTTWTPGSPTLPGYVGRAGDMAVQVTDAAGRPVAPRG